MSTVNQIRIFDYETLIGVMKKFYPDRQMIGGATGWQLIWKDGTGGIEIRESTDNGEIFLEDTFFTEGKVEQIKREYLGRLADRLLWACGAKSVTINLDQQGSILSIEAKPAQKGEG